MLRDPLPVPHPSSPLPRAAAKRATLGRIGPDMNRRIPTLLAVCATVALFTAIAWAVRAIDLPDDAGTSQAPWFRPFRVLAVLGFGIATLTHLPHIVGQFLAAIVLGGLMGGVFAGVRVWLR